MRHREKNAVRDDRHIEAFLEMLSAERGARDNTLAAYRRDLTDLIPNPFPIAMGKMCKNYWLMRVVCKKLFPISLEKQLT
ncbi:MAG: site-specific integrase [Parvularculales bacterium]